VFVVQLLFHKHGAHTLKQPLLRKLEVAPDSINKPLRRLAILAVDAHIFALDDVMLVKPQPAAIKQGIERATAQAQHKVSMASQPKMLYAVQEVVDLHIEKLVANPTTYNADQMLKIQLDMFESCLSKAIAANMPKVTFIHGVGGYVLKRMIVLRLKNHKQVKDFRDAPANKYGNGATEVLFG
jgi:DNA-nicking Smr family endonuclease